MSEAAGPSRPFRILALSGGGVRGIFQAHFLDRLSDALGGDLIGSFELVAATSTGSITAGALAAGVQPKQIIQLFEEVAPILFRRKPLRPLLRGPRYDVAALEKTLKKHLGTNRLGDLPTPLIITASVVDDHRAKVFSVRRDARVSLVDAILASCAAPTYFPPRRVLEDSRAFYDGGLWANDPSALAVQHARDHLRRDAAELRLLAIGTGRTQTGSSAMELDRLRTLSVRTVRTMLEMTGALQSSAADMAVDMALAGSSVVKVNPVLAKWVPLDGAKTALALLPGVAASAFEEHGESAAALLTSSYQPPGPILGEGVDPIAAEGIAIANIKRFTPSRKYYARFREGRESITAYTSLASHELVLVGVNFMTGDTIEHMADSFRLMLERQEGAPTIRLSLLNPSRNGLMEALAGNLKRNPEELQASIQQVVESLLNFRNTLSREKQDCFHVYLHNTLPSSSAIMIDASRPEGVIQLETNVYQAPGIDSYGFEIGFGSEFYDKVHKAYRALINDGDKLT